MDRVLAGAVGIEHERRQQPVRRQRRLRRQRPHRAIEQFDVGIDQHRDRLQTSASPRLLARPESDVLSQRHDGRLGKAAATATVSSVEALSTTTTRTPGRCRATERSRAATSAAELWVTVISAKAPGNDGSVAIVGIARKGRWSTAARRFIVGDAWTNPYTPAPCRMLATTPSRTPRVALVHDFLVDVRGAERVFTELCPIWPDGPIYTADLRRGRHRGPLRRPPDPHLLPPAPASLRSHLSRAAAPVPIGDRVPDLSGYDLVVSSSSAWAHAILCDEHTVHVSYCHNPFRYAWNDRDQTLGRVRNPIARTFLRGAFHAGRSGWRRIASTRS